MDEVKDVNEDMKCGLLTAALMNSQQLSLPAQDPSGQHSAWLGGRGAHEAPLLDEELLAVDGRLGMGWVVLVSLQGCGYWWAAHAKVVGSVPMHMEAAPIGFSELFFLI